MKHISGRIQSLLLSKHEGVKESAVKIFGLFFFPVNFVACESWKMNSFASQMRTALFWVIMQQVVVISYLLTA